jgi:hypothetical protein
MGGGDQGVEVLQAPEQRIHVAIVAHVIAEVGHGGGVEGREPDCVDAEPGQVVQP